LLGFGFAGTGFLLLATAAFTWFMAGVPPQEENGALLPQPVFADLPPALAPAPAAAKPASAPPAASLTAAVAPPQPAGDDGSATEPLNLLPESPLFFRRLADRVESEGENSAGAVGRILIPALDIDAPVMRVSLEAQNSGGRDFYQWDVPDSFAAGWHEDSAKIGEAGHIVLNGHNNVFGAIFGDLAHLPVGEQIVLEDGRGVYVYRVVHHELLHEAGASLRERLANARWIAPSKENRLTLVTCWPNTTNTHRLIVVAEPVQDTQ
jgi:sortase A